MPFSLKYTLLVVWVIFSCLSSFGQTNVSGSVSGTWTKANSPYILTSSVTVPAGQTLTIQAGVEVRVPDYSFQLSINGSLRAQGIASDSIRFVGFSNTAVSGSSHGGELYFASGSTSSVLEYVRIDRMGDLQTYPHAIRTETSSLTVTRSTISNSEKAGINIAIAGISPVITATRFVNNPVAISAAPSSVGGVSSLTNAAISLRSEATSTSCLIPKPGLASFYQLEGGTITISASTTATIQAGAELRFLSYYDRFDVSGTLLAKGTVSDSVRFVGYSNTAVSGSSHGGELYFGSSSTKSVLDYVSIDRLGDTQTYPNAIQTQTSSLTITRSSVRNSENISINIATTSISPVITATHFVNNPVAISAAPSSVGGISSLTNVAVSLRSEATNTSCTIPKLGPSSYYRLEGGTITVTASTTTTIQAGTELRLLTYWDRFDVSGTLIAKGTVSDSVRFVGYSNTAVSGSSHGGELYFSSSSTHSVLDYVSIDRMGDTQTYPNAIQTLTSSLTVTRSSIRNSENIGINIATTGISPVITATRFVNNPVAISAAPSSVGGISSLTNVSVNLRAETTNTSCLIPKPGPGSFYQLPGSTITISASTTATIQAGVELRSTSYADLLTVNGTLIAKGSVSDSIRFVGFANPTYNVNSSHGGMLYFVGSRHSVLEYVVIDRWGDAQNYSTAVSMINSATVSLTNSVIRNAEATALSTQASSVSLTNSVFQTSGGVGIDIVTPGITPRLSGLRFGGNSQDVLTYLSSVGGVSSLTNVSIGLRTETVSSSCVVPKPGPGSYYQFQPGANITISASTTATIQAGVELRSTSYADLLTVNGTLIAKGSVSDSIRFVGFANPTYNVNSSHGGMLYFVNGSRHSVLEYVVIDRWGDAQNYSTAIQTHTSSLTITRSSIRNSENTGINIATTGISPPIAATHFATNGQDVLTYPSSVSGLSGLVNAAIHLRNETINATSVIPKPGPGSYYVLNGSGFSISANTVTTIQPGVEIRSLYYSDQILVYGTLVAKGTASDSIRFRGFANPTYNVNSTHGGQLYFTSGSTNSQLEYVVMDRWGDKDNHGNAIFIYTPSVNITKSVIRNSETAGIKVGGAAISPSIYANTFAGNFPDIDTYPDGCSGILNNTNAKILINGGSISANTTWPFPGPGSYYSLNNQVQILPAYTLTIEAGTLVDFSLEPGELYVNGALRAIGTETAPIQFTRLQSPSASTPAGRVYLAANSANSVLNYVSIDKLGSISYGYPALHIATTNFSAANITLSNAQNFGLQCDNVGNAVFVGSNFFNNKTGVYVTSGKPTFNRCNIYGNTDFGINNVSNAVADTVDARTSYWGTVSGPYHPSLNATGTGDKVSNKVKFNPWSQQPLNGQIIDIGISAILAPTTDCNHTATDSIRVRISNYGNVSQTNFPVSYRVNSSTVTTETVSAITLLPGRSIDYTFTKRVNLSAIASYTITTFTGITADTVRANDTLRTVIQHLPGIAAPTNLVPANNATNLDVAVPFTWGAVMNAVSYDLYVWRATETVPTQPTVADLTQITYTMPTNSLQYGIQYKWKVVAKRISCRASSAVLTFTIRQLPDLIVESITRPMSATSETDIVISWRVKNQGTGSTQGYGWTDIAYLCDQPALNTGVDNFYIGSLPNFSALNAGQAYPSGNLTFRVPQGTQGTYYVIVQTNPFLSLQESTVANNQLVSAPINIVLVPPPDLQVKAGSVVVSPLNAFSDDSVTVSYTVKNMGAGPTTVANWTDHILIGQTEAVNVNTEPVLYSHQRQQVLLVNQEYTISTKVKLPGRIGGTYYVHVVTDRFNQVYEYNLEENNGRASLPMTITQRPTPNLVVEAISINADTVANNQPVTVQWTTANEGAITANPIWQENIYLSTDTTFTQNIDRYVGNYLRTDPLNSLSSSSIQQVVNIPANLAEGSYYFFVKTDAGDDIYENPQETDNVSTASRVIHVVNPDLKPVSLSAPATANSEQAITVQWKVKNDSRAGIYNSNWVDKLYLSVNNTFEVGTDILLTAVSFNQLLIAGRDYSKQATVNLPVGVSGSYSILVITDAENNLFEKLETNNVQAAPVVITLTPWPDLQATLLAPPAADTVGTTLAIQYRLTNTGAGSIDAKNWTDNIYLSPTGTINEASLIYLGNVSRTRSLTNGQSFTQTASFTIPAYLTSGPYYVVVRTDVENKIFEHTGEGNNTAIAPTATAVAILPAIDLAVTAGEVLSTTVTAGKPVNIQWTVKNNSDFGTLVPSWKDAVYLSANPALDASDILLSTVTVSTPVAAGATYTRTHTVTIPADASGTLYILVTTDKDNQNSDDKRGNNTLALTNSSGNGQAVTIVVPPPSDLVPISLLGPAQGTASQPISVSFTVKNNGTGPTSSSTWTDQLYLSTDLQLGTNDILVATFAHTGALTPGAAYTLTDQVFLPNNVSGNYILLLKTDAGNTVYEKNNEENNLAFANLFINQQQPSDLVVTEINFPTAEQYAGNTTTISWKLANIGPNATNGFLREAIYLSKDETLDAKDVLFGTLDQTTFLPSQATENRTLTKPLTNITVGEYYVLIKTDILNNIVEQNEENNQAISPGKMTVNVKLLPINVLTADVLPNNLPLYYRLEIPPGLATETLSVTLKGDSAKNAVNRLFVQKDSVPTPNRFAYSSTVPFTTNQTLIIPDLQAGTYYLLGLGADTSKTIQPVSLLAKVIPFSVIAVDAKEGGNTGLVTLKINGARFDANTTFRLRKASELIDPYRVQYIDQTLVYVTFDLLNKPTGVYDVQAVKPGSATATLPGSFTIKQGPSNSFAGNGNGGPGYGTGFVCSITNVGFEEQLETYVVAPASVRISTITSFIVYYKNESSVDIPVPTRFLVSLNENVPVGFSVAELSENKQDLILECKEEGGPPGILRPGGGGFFKIYTISNNRTILSIDLVITD